MSTLNYHDFDGFTKAYIRTALWSSTGDDDQPLEENYDHTDFSLEALAKIKDDCERFQERNRDTILTAIDTGKVNFGPGFDDEIDRAGHDFWLTRNFHGSGYWDGDWPEPYATRLTDAAHEFGAFDLYVGDDGLIYGS